MNHVKIKRALEKILKKYEVHSKTISIKGEDFKVFVYDKSGIHIHGFLYADISDKDKSLMTDVKCLGKSSFWGPVDTSFSLMNLQDIVRFGISIDYGFVLTSDELFVRDYSCMVRDLSSKHNYGLIRVNYDEVDYQLFNGVEQLMINLKKGIFNALHDYQESK